MSKGKVVLVDFDDTIETKVNGKVVLNEKLVAALKAAQKDGAKIVGFTNWYSENYRLGSPSRESIIQALKNEGLVLDGMNTTWNFLHVYNLVNDRKQPGQSHQGYLDSLNEDARLALLNDFYTSKILPVEKNYDYTKGADQASANAMKQVEDSLKPLRIDAQKNMGLAAQLSAEYAGGKEEMFRVVFSVLGKDKDYVVFDDKIEVKKVAEALAKTENVSVHGFFVGEMKARQQGATIPENYDYNTAIAKPELAKIESPIASIKPVLDALHVHKDPKASELHGKVTLIQEAFDALRKKCGSAEIQAAKLAVAQLDAPETQKQIAKIKINPEMVELKAKLHEAMGHYEQYHRQENTRPKTVNFDGINLDVLKNNTDWSTPECKKVISAINVATAQVINDTKLADRAQTATTLTDIYKEVMTLPGCTSGHSMAFHAKTTSLQKNVLDLESRSEHISGLN